VPDIQRLSAFCAMSLLLSAVPGPSVLFVVGRALAHGRPAALRSVAGNAIGGYALVIAVALGVGTVVAKSAPVFLAIKIAGAAYLVHLGVQALRGSRRTHREVSAAQSLTRGRLRQTWEGFTVGVTNPKSVVFLTAVLPQFVDRGAGHVVSQMLLLGLAGAVLQMASDSVWGLSASAARAWLGRSPRRMSLLGGTGGLVMIGLGVAVAFTGRVEHPAH
jgi:threonine/homoserine/homoserine lactone efflux protein